MNPFETIDASAVPWISTAQMLEVDRVMVEDLGIELIQMMENAGRSLAEVARRRFLGGDPRGRRVVAFAGTGGNGGGALVAARRLHGAGADVVVVLGKPVDRYRGVPAHQLEILRRMGIPLWGPEDVTRLGPIDLLLDGLIGYGISGSPRDDIAALIRWANRERAPMLSLDVPSGLDATTGEAHEPTVEAAATMTLALPKTGLGVETAAPLVGDLFLADIGVPPEVYTGPGLEFETGPLFARGDLLRVV